jgi:hypothetical protein
MPDIAKSIAFCCSMIAAVVLLIVVAYYWGIGFPTLLVCTADLYCSHRTAASA